jgi:hypothetical protein
MGAHLKPELAAYAAPSDADLLVQARAASAKALLAVEVHGDVATVRLVGADGRERERKSVKLAGDVAPLAKLVDDMLVPPVIVREHWYQSKWAWAAGAAVLTAAVLVPVTAAIAGDTGAKSGTARPSWPMGLPW